MECGLALTNDVNYKNPLLSSKRPEPSTEMHQGRNIGFATIACIDVRRRSQQSASKMWIMCKRSGVGNECSAPLFGSSLLAAGQPCCLYCLILFGNMCRNMHRPTYLFVAEEGLERSWGLAQLSDTAAPQAATNMEVGRRSPFAASGLRNDLQPLLCRKCAGDDASTLCAAGQPCCLYVLSLFGKMCRTLYRST